MTRDPQTPHEWQEAADLAEFYLLIHSARSYGLVHGGPEIDVLRCINLRVRAMEHRIRPAPRDVLLNRYLPAIAGDGPNASKEAI